MEEATGGRFLADLSLGAAGHMLLERLILAFRFTFFGFGKVPSSIYYLCVFVLLLKIVQGARSL
jgi:hypothetical protein